MTNTERQRKFKEKMYNAGFKQSILWLKRDSPRKRAPLTREVFFKKLARLSSGWDATRLNGVLLLLLDILEAKKEVFRNREP